jgi:diguanylate cyclase (GGDEF)-like protein
MQTNDKKLKLANIELAFQIKEKDRRADELILANKELAFQNKEKDRRADELILANIDKDKRADELALANIELTLQNKEKDKRADELGLANIQKDKRADEFGLANIQKDKRADELALANIQKDKRADELALANIQKDKRADELALANIELANIELAFQNKEKDKRADELDLANIELAFQIKEKDKRADELDLANIELAFQIKEKDKRADELDFANIEKDKRADELALANEHLEHIAHFDILTNLPNRSLLADRLSHAMLLCVRHQQSLAVVFLDLDGFKAINDRHGHDVGDELIIALSHRMKDALREGDTLARFGGDEFVAILADLDKVEDCEPLLERLLLAASEPVTVGDMVLNISASIGVTFYPQDSVNADQLMRHADQAMYVAKELGKDRYHIFDIAQDDAVKVQRASLKAIRYALDNHQFVLHYQPKVNMQTGAVIGFEALIRWQHPTRGLLNPIEFLPVIERHAIMIEMGEWVIDTALTQISQWQGLGRNLPVSTSVNIAAVQLQQPNFMDRLATMLAAHPNVKPHHLELEVLETSALNDVQHASSIMNACIALGVGFALDDFGTGYSSLTYLRRLPASLIKIDQSFVLNMLTDTDDLAMIEGVIGLAKLFKRKVIAEGVETIEHATALLQIGCELAQGYGIARPMPAAGIPIWVNNWKPDDAWKGMINN